MFLRNPFTALLLSFAFSSSIYATNNILPYKTNVEVDGINNEWGTPLPKYDKNTCINYNIANDERNIYLILRIADTAIQKQIFINGFEVWVNKEGKKKKTTGVTFPLSMSKNLKTGKTGKEPQNKSSEKDTPEGMTSTDRLQPTGMEALKSYNVLILNGFLLDNGKQSIKNCPVRVSVSKDKSNFLIYELAIPFNTFYKECLDETDTKVKFCIGFVVKGNDSSDSNEMSVRMSGMGRPGMGGPGMGGPEEGMGGASTSSTSANKEFWFKTSLSTQKDIENSQK